MARIEPEDVEEVTDIDLEPTDVQAFVDDAHRIVQRRCAPYVSEDLHEDLATTEVYLAAHLLTSKSPQIQSTSAGVGVNVSYVTRDEDFWHKAILADPSGRLARPDGWSVMSTHQES